MTQNIVILIAGFILLVEGADFVVKGAVMISKKLHLSQMLIGIVLVGIGTSLPEIIVTVESAFKGESDIILGNAVGSSICNILLVIGMAGILREMKIDKRLYKTHLPMSILTIIVLFIVCNFGNATNFQIDRTESIILFIITLLYTIFTFFEGKNVNEDSEEVLENNKESYLKIFAYIVFGIVGLKIGADYVINESVNIAKIFSVPTSIISMTVIAVGTALPEIATSIIAVIRKDSDLAIGNVIGSNLYNICLLPSIAAIISPINYSTEFNSNIIYLLLFTLIVLLLINIGKKGVIERKKSIIMLLIYFAYSINLFVQYR